MPETKSKELLEALEIIVAIAADEDMEYVASAKIVKSFIVVQDFISKLKAEQQTSNIT